MGERNVRMSDEVVKKIKLLRCEMDCFALDGVVGLHQLDFHGGAVSFGNSVFVAERRERDGNLGAVGGSVVNYLVAVRSAARLLSLGMLR